MKKTKLCKQCQKPIKKKIKNKHLIGITKFCSEECYYTNTRKAPEYPKAIDEIGNLDYVSKSLVEGIVRSDLVQGTEQKKQKPERDKVYRRFINNLPCAICGTEGSEAAHTEYCGLGIKGSDLSCINLCAECHRGSKGLDSIGREKFEKYHSVSIKDLNIKCLRLYIRYLKDKK